MSTFISGVASCAAIDTSGEVVDIKGLDISSLPITGVLNFEHDVANTAKGEKLVIHLPAQIVGKIIKAKKIFDAKDCADEDQLKFWNKTKLPFVYIIAELLDDYCASAKEVAGKFKYSKDHPEQRGIFGFSVEGSELPNSRQGVVITRSIGRKVTITQAPANHLCIAEIYEAPQPSQVKDDFEEIFKSESNAIEMFKSEQGSKVYEQFLAKKEQNGPHPKNISQEYENVGIRPGKSSSGESVYSHGNVRPYKYNPQEHQHGGEHHNRAVVTAQNPKLTDNAPQRHAMHANAAASGGRQENRPALSLNQKQKEAGAVSRESSEMNKSEKPSWSAGNVKDNGVHFNHPEHGTVSVLKQPSGEFHVKHNGAMAGLGGIKPVFSDASKAKTHAANYMQAVSAKKVLPPRMHQRPSPSMIGKSEKPLNKALEAASYNAAPSSLTSGAAYQKESISRSQANMGDDGQNLMGTKKKTDWNKRAKEEYERWPKREAFEKFLKARMPHLHDGEVKAIGRMAALSKSLDFEKSLGNLVKSEKSDKELSEKTLEQIQVETAKTWADRAETAYKKAIEEKSVKWLVEAEEYAHEAIEHSALSEDTTVFDKIKKEIIPLRKEAIKLLVPGAKV